MSADLDIELERMRMERARLDLSLRLQRAADEAVERAMRDRSNLGVLLQEMFEILSSHIGASYAWVRTFDETLELRDYQWQADPAARSPLWTALMLESLVQLPGEVFRGVIDERRVVAMRLEVAGVDFGLAAVMWEGPIEPPDATLSDDLAGLFEIWCEVLDNHLAAHAEARRRQQILSLLSDALRKPILSDGVVAAIEVLREHMELESLALVYNPDGRPSSVDTSFVYLDKDGSITNDREHGKIEAFLDDRGIEVLHGELDELRDLMGNALGFDDLLVSGLTEKTVVGRVIAAVPHSEPSTHDRELLVRFADYLRQRLVDFNREYQRLSYAFSPQAVIRLLNEERYLERLEPREENVVVLYTDIAGFTRLSEQVLREPALIGKLVDIWGDAVVDILWKHGGTFDKMVGDCVIGLFGPPFFDLDPKDACLAAIRAAREIELYTRHLYAEEALPQLEDQKGKLGVATGINYCPMYVGRFGPNEDYTGFSSGMNNTARLQGVATLGEILCMDSVVELVDGDEDVGFGDWRDAKVKNVAEPLKFKAVQVEDDE